MESEVRFSGFGGQGVILMGIVLGRAAAVYDRSIGPDGKEIKKSAIQTQSYGPSARGGHSKCDVKISTGEMRYPFVEVPDYLVILSKQAYSKYISDVKPATTIIIDPGLVQEKPPGKVFLIPATKEAERLGTRVVANIIMLGAFREISDLVSYDALERAMMDSLPKATHDLNKSALRVGRKLGQEALAAEDKD